MTSKTDRSHTLQEVQNLAERVPHFREILETCSITGVCTKQQIARALGISEKEASQALEEIVAFAKETDGKMVILDNVNLDRHLWPRRGNIPVIYRLGSAGAAFLQEELGKAFSPCQLSAPDQVGHALCLLDGVLKARELRYPEVVVEQPLDFGLGTIRPDLLVSTPQGYLDIEIEQVVGPDHLRRIRQLLRHRAEFFLTPHAEGFVPRILVVFNAGRSDWPRVQRLWRQAIATLDTKLPFHLWATTLAQFEQCRTIDDLTDWVDLTEPAGLRKEATQIQTAAEKATGQAREASSLAENIVIMLACRQHFEEAARPKTMDFFAFCDLVEAIAEPSLWGKLDGSTGVEMPRASLEMFRTFLEMRPDLQVLLKKRMWDGAELNRWSLANTPPRLKSIVRAFLSYFGLSPDGGLSVLILQPNAMEDRDEFAVRVRMTVPWPEEEGQVRYVNLAYPEPARFEEALTFVLHLLFHYPEELGFRRPAYL